MPKYTVVSLDVALILAMMYLGAFLRCLIVVFSTQNCFFCNSIYHKTVSYFQVQETADQVGQMPATSCINVELSKETLDTMLDGLGKIREQLSSVAK